MAAGKDALSASAPRPASGALRKSSKERGGATAAATPKVPAIDTELILSKFASFDFPAPPSPAHCSPPPLLRKSSSSPSMTGSVKKQYTPYIGGLASITRLPETAKFIEPEVRTEQMRLRTEIWSSRIDIEKEKLSYVSPFPFFGHAMRFQDEFCALQITDDGRFIYSVCGSEEDGRQHICTTYEGVFGPAENLADAVLDPTARPSKEYPEGALIEGRALVKHDIAEEKGTSRLVHVERGFWRLAITVFPFVQPNSAAVHLLKAHSPGNPAPRCRRIPHVGPGFLTKDLCNGLFPRHRREGQRAKFSRTSTTLMLGGKSATKSSSAALLQGRKANKEADEEVRQARPTSAIGTSSIGKETSLTKKNGPETVAEWKEYYRKRAEEILKNEPRMPPTTTKITKTSYGFAG